MTRALTRIFGILSSMTSTPIAGTPPITPRLDTGIAGFNEILNGGLPPAQMYLLEGDPGTGKSTIAVQYAVAAARREDRAIVYAFDEGRLTAIERAEALGKLIPPSWPPVSSSPRSAAMSKSTTPASSSSILSTAS